jgi:hypothetical protein
MRTVSYVSIDIETLGLNPCTCDVIEFGAVLETMVFDSAGDPSGAKLGDLPTFHCYLTKPNNVYMGEPYAMWMNAKILKRIADREKGYTYMPGDMLDEVFAEWLEEQKMTGKIVVAGKNFQAFDMRFLERLGFGSKVKIHHRGLDPGSMFFNPVIHDVPPGLNDCLALCKVQKEVAHTAVEDALDVIRCIRHRYLIHGEL